MLCRFTDRASHAFVARFNAAFGSKLQQPSITLYVANSKAPNSVDELDFCGSERVAEIRRHETRADQEFLIGPSERLDWEGVPLPPEREGRARSALRQLYRDAVIRKRAGPD